jgi:hypothetical protein
MVTVPPTPGLFNRHLPPRLPLQLSQPVLNSIQTALHPHDVHIRAAIRNNSLVQFQRAPIIVRRFLNLILLLRQPAHVARIPPQALAAVR